MNIKQMHEHFPDCETRDRFSSFLHDNCTENGHLSDIKLISDKILKIDAKIKALKKKKRVLRLELNTANVIKSISATMKIKGWDEYPLDDIESDIDIDDYSYFFIGNSEEWETLQKLIEEKAGSKKTKQNPNDNWNL